MNLAGYLFWAKTRVLSSSWELETVDEVEDEVRVCALEWGVHSTAGRGNDGR